MRRRDRWSRGGFVAAAALGTARVDFSRSGLLLPRWFDDDPESMRRSANHTTLTDEVARFQAEVQRLALAAAQAIVREEIDRRLAKVKPARPRSLKPARSDASAVPAPAPAAVAPAAAMPEAAAPGAAAVPATEPPREQTPGKPAGRKRVPWTREAIIEELASWMMGGTAIDATFVTRHGPPGLVAATRRIFGRFDAALNVAGLHVSRLYPDGPPARGQT
jgi:hypothetical protein